MKTLPQVGLEPTTFGLEVQRAIHCATGACQDDQKSTLESIQIQYKALKSNSRYKCHGSFQI